MFVIVGAWLAGVMVGVFVGVLIGVLVGVSLGVFVGVSVGVFVGVFVGVSVGVSVGVFVGVSVAVGVPVGVFVGVSVAVGVSVGVGVFSTSVKQTVTSFKVGVTLLSVVLRYALYLRYRKPLNWLSDALLVVKYVALVVSGPTKLNGPFESLLPAAWNITVVPLGVLAVHDSVVQFGVLPTVGFASFSEETKLPDEAKPVFM
jgi:hypothetical protein